MGGSANYPRCGRKEAKNVRKVTRHARMVDQRGAAGEKAMAGRRLGLNVEGPEGGRLSRSFAREWEHPLHGIAERAPSEPPDPSTRRHGLRIERERSRLDMQVRALQRILHILATRMAPSALRRASKKAHALTFPASARCRFPIALVRAYPISRAFPGQAPAWKLFDCCQLCTPHRDNHATQPIHLVRESL